MKKNIIAIIVAAAAGLAVALFVAVAPLTLTRACGTSVEQTSGIPAARQSGDYCEGLFEGFAASADHTDDECVVEWKWYGSPAELYETAAKYSGLSHNQIVGYADGLLANCPN